MFVDPSYFHEKLNLFRVDTGLLAQLCYNFTAQYDVKKKVNKKKKGPRKKLGNEDIEKGGAGPGELAFMRLSLYRLLPKYQVNPRFCGRPRGHHSVKDTCHPEGLGHMEEEE